MQTLNWQAREPELRAEWQAKYGKTGLDWQEIREAHCYGWGAALRPEFADAEFADVEADLAEHWYRPLLATEESAWDYVREAAYEGWRKAREQLGQRARGQ